MLTLLWPPASLSEDVSLIEADAAYLYSTFELQAHGNINVHSENIMGIDKGITKVAVQPRAKVYKKNAELTLEFYEHESVVLTELPIVHKTASDFQVADNTAYLFNRSGVLPLSKGAIVKMTPGSEVRHYSSGYLYEVVTPQGLVAISEELLLQDAQIYYKRSEPFVWNDFVSLNLSQIAFQYIEKCEATGLINSAVKNLIKEGRI